MARTFGKISTCLFLVIALLTDICVAGKDVGGGYITLINATPYKWTRTEIDKNKVRGSVINNPPDFQTDWNWPETIDSGESRIEFFRWDDGARNKAMKDSKVEALVTYKLKDTKKPASFKLHVSHEDKMVYAELLEELETLGNPKNSIIKVGYNTEAKAAWYPGQSFIVAGNEGNFISTNPPVAWMQASLDTLGNRTLRELVLPASHNSGIQKLTSKRGGYEHIDQTQTLTVYEQLERGVRILDVRPSYWVDPVDYFPFTKSKDAPWRSHTGALVRCGNFRANQVKVWIGGTGMTLEDVVRQVNQFNDDYPGELIFIRVRLLDMIYEDYEIKMHHLTWWLQQLKYRGGMWLPDNGDGSDLGKYQLRSLITKGKNSAVYVMMPSRWVELYKNIAPDVENGNERIINIDQDSQLWWARNYKFYAGDTKHSIEDLLKESKKAPMGPFTLNVTGTVGIDSLASEYQLVPYTVGDRQIDQSTPGKFYSGFYEHSYFSWHNEYAGVSGWENMARKQGELLKKYRQSPYDEPFMLKWFVSQSREETVENLVGNGLLDDKDVDSYHTSLLGLATTANARLYDWLWEQVTPASYPNAIEIDSVEDSQITALAMAIMWYHGGQPELFHGVGGMGSSNKTDNEIREIMKREAEISEKIDVDTASLQLAEAKGWDDYIAGVPKMEFRQKDWARFQGTDQGFRRRVAICSDDGKLCEGDD